MVKQVNINSGSTLRKQRKLTQKNPIMTLIKSRRPRDHIATFLVLNVVQFTIRHLCQLLLYIHREAREV